MMFLSAKRIKGIEAELDASKALMRAAVDRVCAGDTVTVISGSSVNRALAGAIMVEARHRVPCGPIGWIRVVSLAEAKAKERRNNPLVAFPGIITIDEAHEGFDAAVVAKLAEQAKKAKPGPVPVGHKVQCNLSLEAESVAQADGFARVYGVSRSRVVRDALGYALRHVDKWAQGLDEGEGGNHE